MRLTLRTLLAYLDDTLDPEQARLIGQKVAESPVAQELIERIKKVTRRRSLANPPVLGDSSRLDPNSVAEYLDSQLGAEELSQVEQTCLDEDVYLAEVAACHQILTLMLSEPTRVPPTARQRMYRLVKGREAIHFRKPPVFPADVRRDVAPERREEAGPVRWPLFVAGALLLVGLAAAVSLAWPRPQPPRKIGANQVVAVLPPKDDQTSKLPEAANNKKPETSKNNGTGPAGVDASKAGTAKPAGAASDAAKPNGSKPNGPPPPPPPPMPQPEKKPLDRIPSLEPSKERKEIGEFVSTAALIENRDGSKDNWRTVVAKSRITSGYRLIALPGSQCDIKLDSGVQISLWGNLLEFLPLMEFESAIVPHVPSSGFDAELTLLRGRIQIKNLNINTPAKVRLRFHDQVWDLTFAAKSETVADLLFSFGEGARFSRQTGGESPMIHLFLGVPMGKVTVQVRDLDPIKLTAPPGPALLGWDNKSKIQPPAVLKEALPQWAWNMPTKSPAKEAAMEMKSTADALVARLTEKGATPSLALEELAESQKPSAQLYAAFSLPAIDKVAPLVDSLDNLPRAALRGAAVISLRNWVARNPENALVLYHMLLDKKGYTQQQADAVLQLLHTFSREDVAAPATYELLFGFLNDEKLSVRELALWHLVQLDPEGARQVNYNPLQDERMPAINRWKKRLTEGKIPPKAPKSEKPDKKSPFDTKPKEK